MQGNNRNKHYFMSAAYVFLVLSLGAIGIIILLLSKRSH